MADAVLFTQEDHVAILTLNRPEVMNTLNRELIAQLEELTGKIKNNPHIRAVIIRGAGEVFMGGSDLCEINSEIEASPTETMYQVRQFNAATFALREMDKPVLAIVHGFVSGAGMSLMMAADLVVASESTRFSMGYCNIAMSPAGGATYYLPRLIGHKKAMQLLLMSEIFDTHTAESLGLINWIVPQCELNDYAKNVIDHLATGAILAFSQTKQLINSSWQNKLATQLELEAEAFVKTVNSRDFKAAVRASINKRQPEYEGR